MKRRIGYAAALVLTLGAPLAWGSGFHLEEYHAAYVGQATAGITMSESAGVVATLPAAMVRLPRGVHALGGVTRYDSRFEATGLDGSDPAHTIHGPSVVPHLYGVHNNGDWAWGIGQYYPFGVKIAWREDWPGRRLFTEQGLSVGYTSLVGAYALGETVSLGVGLNRAAGTAVQKKFTSTPLAPGIEVLTVVEAHATEWVWNLSLLHDTGTFAAALIHAPPYTLKGQGTVEFAPGNPLGLKNQGVRADLLLPSVTEAALSYRDAREHPTWFAEFTVVRTGWSNYRELRIRFDALPDSVTERDWKDTTGYKLGGNVTVARGTDSTHRLRAGVFLDESPSPNHRQRPGEDGAGRTNAAAGYGYLRGDFRLDLAYFLVSHNPSRTLQDNEFPARHRARVDILSASLGYRW